MHWHLKIPRLVLECIDLQSVCGRRVRAPIRFLRSNSTKEWVGLRLRGLTLVVLERMEGDLIQGGE